MYKRSKIMHYSGGNTNTNRRRGRKSSGIENRIRNSKRISGTSNSSSSGKGGEDFDEEDEEEFLVDESELLFGSRNTKKAFESNCA